MNEFEPVTLAEIDRLVDGELSSTERRRVLIALDQDDGWRRLALAFLEAQAMREGLRNGIAENSISLVPQPVVVAQSAKRLGAWRLPVTIVASCLLMFLLGRMSNSSSNNVVSGPGTNLPKTYAPLDDDVNPLDASPMQVVDSGSSGVKLQTLRLELGDGRGGTSQVVEVPMVENSGIRPEDLLTAPPVVPDSVQRALLRMGRRVYEQRQLVEVMLEDGRRGVVPVSDVMVENAGWDVYQ